MAIRIDVISDFVCPWCWIGKRNMDRLAETNEIERRWHPYFLHPDLPAEGVERAALVKAKFGSEERARELGKNVAAAGREAGVEIDYSKVKRVPNTANAHRLARWASGQGVADAVAESLFSSYFFEGLDIGDTGVLADIGADAGLDRDLLTELLAGNADLDKVTAKADFARRNGISGVPTHIFAQQFSVIGAQPVENLQKAVMALEGEAVSP